MEIQIVEQLRNDAKLHSYLITHSYWYRLLNRNSKYYDDLLKEYKTYKRNTNFNKVNDVIDNVELFSNVIKFI